TPRQPHREHRALADLTPDLDRSVMEPHHLARQVEAYSRSSRAARERSVDHVELLEDPREVLGGDADPEVLDLEGHRLRLAPAPHDCPAPGAAVLERVVDELAHD